jgi:hypothetical protein
MHAHKVIDFKTTKEADTFLELLRTGISKRQKDYESNRFPMTFGPIKVIVQSLDVVGSAAFAEERKSVPRHTEMTLFLNEGAYIACKELNLGVVDLGGTDNTIPSQAKEIINEDFRTRESHPSVEVA